MSAEEVAEGLAAAGVIRQSLLKVATDHAQDLEHDYPLTIDEALIGGIDQTIASVLASAGYFDAKLPDTDVAAELERTKGQLDAFLGFATKLAEVASVQEPSDLVDGVEDLVDEVITKMLGEGSAE